MAKLKNTDFFFCYNSDLKNYLVENNVDFITSAYSIKTQDRFWLFQKSDELQELLNKYNNNKHNKVTV